MFSVQLTLHERMVHIFNKPKEFEGGRGYFEIFFFPIQSTITIFSYLQLDVSLNHKPLHPTNIISKLFGPILYIRSNVRFHLLLLFQAPSLVSPCSGHLCEQFIVLFTFFGVHSTFHYPYYVLRSISVIKNNWVYLRPHVRR